MSESHTAISLAPGLDLMVPADLVGDPTTTALVEQCKEILVPAGCVDLIDMIVNGGPDTWNYVEALIDTIESVDTSDTEAYHSAILSHLATRFPRLVDMAARALTRTVVS